jgi:GGDEF domain-containing protein
LQEDRFKQAVYIANALLCVALVAVLGLPVLGMPGALVLGAIVAGIQAFVLRLHFMEPAEGDEDYDKLVTQVQRQVDGARKSAIYDPNVGLYQRWYLETRLKQEIARSRRYGLSLALIVVRFEQRGSAKLSDDEWQSQAVEAARMLGTRVRNVDLAANLGEREFAISLVHCDRRGAELAMERLSEALGERFDFKMGLTVFPDDDAEPGRLIELAQGRVGPYAALLVSQQSEATEGEGPEVLKPRFLSA